MADNFQFIPNDAVDAESRSDLADSWAADERAKLAQRWADAQRAAAPPVPLSTPPIRDDWATNPGAGAGTGVSAQSSPPTTDTSTPLAAWAPSQTSRQVSGWTPPTTAGISGGIPQTVSQTGGAFYGLDDSGMQVARAAGDMARQLGYGDEGAHAVQSVLLTEGGLTGARGDYGQSAGPLQFFAGGGQMDNFARQNGMSVQDAQSYVEQNPLEAIRWALGTQDRPGYLGGALKYGISKGLTGPALATYIQAKGQISQSPERAGQWHNLLFANGQDPFSAPITAGAAGATGRFDTAPMGAPATGVGVANAKEDRGYQNQFQLGLSDADAYAACGPAAAIAFAKAYGRNPTADEAMRLARQVGWSQQAGMAGVASEQALLNRLGVSTKLEQDVDWNHVASDANNGNPVVVSTPGHYFYIDGTAPGPGGNTLFHVGASGTALKGGSEYMTVDQIQQRMGRANGALYSDHPSAEGPSVAESQPLPAQPDTGTDAYGRPLNAATGPSLGGVLGAIGQKKNQLLQAVQDLGSQVQSPNTSTGGLSLYDIGGTAASALGTAVQAGAGALREVSPASNIARGVAGQEQIASENAPLYNQLAGLMQRYRDAKDRGDTASMDRLATQIQPLQDQWNSQVASQVTDRGQLFGAAERNPNLGLYETTGNVLAGGAGMAVAAGEAPLAARALASAIDPQGQLPGQLLHVGVQAFQGAGQITRQAGESVADAAARIWPDVQRSVEASPEFQAARPAEQAALRQGLQQALQDQLVSGETPQPAPSGAKPTVQVPTAEVQSAIQRLDAGDESALNDLAKIDKQQSGQPAPVPVQPAPAANDLIGQVNQLPADQQRDVRATVQSLKSEAVPATSAPASRSWDNFFRSPEFDQLSLSDKRNAVQQAQQGGSPPALTGGAASSPTASVGIVASSLRAAGTVGPRSAPTDLYGPTELAAGLTPRAVQRAGQQLFAPATRATTEVQTALNTMDASNRGLQTMVDNLVKAGTITQDTATGVYAGGKRSAYEQLLGDVQKAADPSGNTGVVAKGTAPRPSGWVDGNDYNVDNTWISPETRDVVDNIRGQMLNRPGAAMSNVMKAQGLAKEAALGGSVFHLSAEMLNAAFLNREQAPRVIGQALLGAIDPTGRAFDSIRFSQAGSQLFQRAAEAGVTQLSRTPEGELVDLFTGARGLAIRSGIGGAAGFTRGYLTASNDQNRFSNALEEGLKGAAGGAFASYMIPTLWQRGVPLLKALSFGTLTSRGLPDQAAATMINNVFGGENLVRIARDPTVQQVMRITAFAPDWWTNIGRTLARVADLPGAGQTNLEYQKFAATAAASFALFSAGMNYALAGHGPLQNDPDHLADIDMTKLWGKDPRTGQNQYLRVPGPWPEVISAITNPGKFLVSRAGIVPNLVSEALTAQPLGELSRSIQAGRPSGYYIPNVAVSVGSGRNISEYPSKRYGQPAQNFVQRALDVLAQQLENMEPAGVTSAEQMAQRGGLPAGALSLLTGVGERSERAGPGASRGSSAPSRTPVSRYTSRP